MTIRINEMKRLSATLVYILISAVALPLPVALADTDKSADNAYRVQPGDVLEVSVWREESLEKNVLVRPDGGVSFPLTGDMQAAGKTIEELQIIVAEKLEKYIPDPVVTVSIQQLSGNKFYVIGKVARPGEFIANRYVDVMQALSVAGGMTPYASANKIKVLRRENGRLISLSFRYGDVEKGKNLEQNIILQSGDVVVVP